MAEQIKSITELPVGDILVEQRLREVGEAGVEAIIASVGELGIIKDPIHVRKVPHRDNKLVLMAGGHRLEAAKRMGWDTIPATVWLCNDTWARLIEVDDNLASAELTALDNAIFLAERKRLYEELHPEAREASGAALAARRWNAADMMSAASFAKTTAEKFGISERHVRRMAAAGSMLDPKDRQQLRLAPRPVTLADLQQIAKIGNPVERYEVCRRMAVGEVRSAAEARKAWAQRENPPPPVDKDEKAFLTLLKLWQRTGKVARRRFVTSALDELAPIIDEIEADG